MTKVYNTKAAANQAAHRAFRKHYGAQYKAKQGVDFTVSRDIYSLGWKFAVINKEAHGM